MPRTVEDAREIDINWCNRQGFLDESQSGVLRWTNERTGEVVASLNWRYVEWEGTDTLRLAYTITPPWRDEDTRDVSYPVPVEWTPCNFGGERPWFRCPVCDNRVAKLYSPSSRDEYACRECQGLIYEAQTHTKPMVEAFSRLDEASERIKEGNLSYDALRELYDAKQGVFSTFNDHMDDRDERYESYGWETEQDRRFPDLPPFEEWADDLFHQAFGSAGGRAYGFYGRCTATAKTTGERCRQPATGDHGKCHYHGGAPGSGVGEEQRDRQAEAARERIQRLLEEREEREVAPNSPAT